MTGDMLAKIPPPALDIHDFSFELAILREGCAKLVKEARQGSLPDHSGVRLLLSYHSRLRSLLNACRCQGMEQPGQELLKVPDVVPPGGQIDRRLLERFGLKEESLPGSWVDKSLVASMLYSLNVTEEAVASYKKMEEEGDDSETPASD